MQPQICVLNNCPVKKGPLRPFSRPFCLDCLLWLLQQVGIIFSIDSMAFLNVTNEHYALYTPVDGGHHCPYWWNPSLVRRRQVFPMHGLPFRLWLKLMNLIFVVGKKNVRNKPTGFASNSANFTYDITSQMTFWSGIKGRGTYRTETFNIPKVVLQNALNSFTEDVYATSYLNNV